MIGQQAIEKHIEECRHRIANIESFMASNSDADLAVCADNIATLRMAAEALEKQIPKKPNLWGDGYADGVLVYDMYECPNCGKNYEVDYEKYDHCPNCGQKLDWSDLK